MDIRLFSHFCFIIFVGIEELNIDLDGGKSRKSSGFSETTAPPANGQMATGTALTANKSRQASGVANSSSSSR